MIVMPNDPTEWADELIRQANALPRRDTPSLRILRRKLSGQWRFQPAKPILDLARELVTRRSFRWIGYELIRNHKVAFAALNDQRLAELTEGLNSWESVDGFGRILAGPAWAHGLATGTLIAGWSHSPDRWLRRTALVCTIALNMPRDGGKGDVARTLRICTSLVADHDDMIEKAMSWALRVLIAVDRDAVRAFLERHEGQLGARIKREVRNKLRTGLKNPKVAII